jgi:hypothetical protein
MVSPYRVPPGSGEISGCGPRCLVDMAYFREVVGESVTNQANSPLVVKNPLSPVEHKGGDGVKNELFELGLDQFIRSLM